MVQISKVSSLILSYSYSYKLRQEVNLEDVAAALPVRCTGADLMQVVSTARSAAVRGIVDKLNSGMYVMMYSQL